MIIIGLHDTTHDYSMSVLYKGKIYSIELERLVGIKKGEYRKCGKKIFFQQFLMGQETNMGGDTLTFGDYGVEIMYKYFSTYLGIKSLEIDLLVSSSGNNYETIINSKKNITPNSHHLMHAHSVYNMSGYKNSNILVIDGAGYNLKNGKIELQSMFYGSGKHIKSLEINYATKKENIGIGIAYSRISDFLGLTEGKMMGLSGYSEKSINYNFFDKQGGRVYLKIELHEIFCNREKFFHYYGLKKSFLRNGYFNKKIINFVFSFQREVESAIIYLANYLYEKNPCENLSYAGGVALNCLTNYRLKTETKYKNIFVLPASNDAGISLGNLFYGVNSVFPSYNINIALYEANYGLGKKYNDDEIITSLSKYEEHLSYKYIGDKLMVQEIFNYIKDNKIVGIFRGGSEFGPRALGNRSIIVSPYVPKISGKLNVIKNREEWRPFGVMMLEKNQEKYFEKSVKSDYMLFTCKLNFDGKKEFREISHTDNTIRLQTISESSKLYFDLLSRLEKIGINGLVNTSLNGKGQPIIEYPEESLNFYLENSGIDFMFIENYLVERKKDSIYEKKLKSNLYIVEYIINSIKKISVEGINIDSDNLYIHINIYSKEIKFDIVVNDFLKVDLVFRIYDDQLIYEGKKNNSEIDMLVENILKNSKKILSYYKVLFSLSCRKV